MKLLREDGYIAMDRYGTVTLLEKGAEIANQIYERHIVLARMLEDLGSGEIAMRMPARWSTTSARRALIRSRHIIITSLRRKKQQNKKHACRQAAGR